MKYQSLTGRGVDTERKVATGRLDARERVTYDVTEVWVGR